MMRSFGLMLVVGIVLAFVVALTVGFAVLGGDLRSAPAAWPAGPVVGTSPSGSRHLAGGGRCRATRPRGVCVGEVAPASSAAAAPSHRPSFRRSAGWGVFEGAIRKPGRTLVIAAVLAVVGWVAGTQIEIVSDLTKLVPANQREVARPQDAAGRDRRLGRHQRRRPLRRRDQPARRALDGRLPEADSRPPRLSGGTALQGGRDLPGAVADQPVHRERLEPEADPRAAGRPAALLLPGRDQPRPQDGQPRLRDPHDAARPAARAGRRHARAAATRRRASTRRSRGCRCWPPTPTPTSRRAAGW